MKITNLYDLRKATNDKTVDLIVTQYIMEAIARGNILKQLENDIYSMDDSESLTVADIKEKLTKYESDVVGGELDIE